MTASVGFAGQAQVAPGAMITRSLSGPLRSRPASRQRDAILIVIALAAAGRLARDRRTARLARDRRTAQHVIMFVIVLAAAAGLARDSRGIPRALAWLLGPRQRPGA